jgi:AcrR family transcriptional regulator
VPKLVDHDRRRLEIVRATYRTIARDGWEAATMATIAAEAGYANGALKPYFATKDDLVAAAFEHIYQRTGARMARATKGKHGLDALRAACREILPLTPATRTEARVVIPFWQQALRNPALAGRHETAMRAWHDQLRGYLAQARAAGELRAGAGDDVLAGLVLTALIGAQVTGTLTTSLAAPRTLAAQLDAVLELIRTP